MKRDLVIIGGGPAGLAAANEAFENGITDILILERENELGGILNQCIHNGFGLHTFKEELTGPEYAERFINLVVEKKIDIMLEATVTGIDEKKVKVITPSFGYIEIEAKAIILAMGCRERTRGAIKIPGDRPSGIFNAGAAQRYINIDGYMPGKEAVILGSGDIGLIMARRLSLEGAKVKAVIELMPYSNGLNRNIVQCLEDYNIPLYLSHTIINIKGKERLQEVTIAKVDENKNIIAGTEEIIKCDTLLLSVGLIPENDLSFNAGILEDKRTKGPIVKENMETNKEGIFACGNVLHVHDLVDFVTIEAKAAGYYASKYIKGENKNLNRIELINGEGINYTVPQRVAIDAIEEALEILFRVKNVYRDKYIVIKDGEKEIKRIKKPHLAPAEMEKITIKKEELLNIKGDIRLFVEGIN